MEVLKAKLLFLKPCSSGAKRYLDLDLAMAEAPVYCSDFSHLNFKKGKETRTAGKPCGMSPL